MNFTAAFVAAVLLLKFELLMRFKELPVNDSLTGGINANCLYNFTQGICNYGSAKGPGGFVRCLHANARNTYK